MSLVKKILHQPLFIKLFNWEYWPFNIVYGPIYLYWMWLCIKARAIFFFNTSNPAIKNGGFLLESKKAIYDLMPAQYYPATLFFKSDVSSDKIEAGIKNGLMQFPLIAKPDVGMRGLAVEKVECMEALLEYAKNSRVDFLVQEFVKLENEAGIFYYRYPSQTKGHISGIVGKEFLTVTGDGQSTVETLLKKDQRFILQLPVLQQSHKEVLKKVLQTGEKELLVPYGNHSRGAKFIDLSYLVDEALLNSLDKICHSIPEFYFGRLDIRYNTWEELREGKNFSIIELNGAGSEPTHIYDPKHSIFFAWKEIIRHLNILYKISKFNHRSLRLPYMNFYSGMRMLKENAAYVKILNNPVESALFVKGATACQSI